MSHSYAKQLTTSSPLTMHKRLPLSGAREKSNNRACKIISLTFASNYLVHRLAYNGDVVAFKMGRRQGGPSRTGSKGRISKSIRNRRATRPPANFQRNPPGRGRL